MKDTKIPSAEKSRLNKAVARLGFCSRRAADALIFAGKVKVNDVVIDNPSARVFPHDKIEVQNHTRQIQANTYVLMNKPVHIISSMRDPQNRKTVIELLPEKYKNLRLFPVGRLDYFSEGLLLLTNDGDLAHRLLHPSFAHVKIYEVEIRGPVSPAALAVMRKGMRLVEGPTLLPAGVKSKILKNGNTLLTLELRQGINRQIRKMCGQLGLTILRLKRIAEAGLRLDNLKPGACRELTENEVLNLRRLTGLE